MPFISEVNDITKIKVDAIANSFGLKSRGFGRICTSVYNALNDNKIKKIFKDADYQVGEIFVTESGELPCNHIINVVTPFYKNDSDCQKLVKAYKDIIDKAISLGCKSVAIPMMGTGANGYERSDSYDALVCACEELLEKEEKIGDDIIEVHFLIYFSSEKKYDALEINRKRLLNLGLYESNNERIIDRNDIFNENEYNFHKNKELSIKNYTESITEEEQKMYQRKIMFLLRPRKFEYVSDCSCDSVFFFLVDMINKKGLSRFTLNKWGLDRRIKGKFKRGQNMTKYNLFMSIIALDLNITETYQLLSLTDYGFKISDAVDRFVIDYLVDELPHFKSKYEFDEFFNKYSYLNSIKYNLEFPNYEYEKGLKV